MTTFNNNLGNTQPDTGKPVSATGTSILRVEHLSKTYKLGRVDVPVLHDVTMELAQGQWVAILGASGSGKSTLLNLIGGLDTPDPNPATTILFNNHDITHFSPAQLDRYRTRSIGLVFQFYHLLPELRVLENVLLGAMIRTGRFGYMKNQSQLKARACELLTTFGLGHRLKHKPAQLSGGERQRVAIARALINEPALLLADEPTGNLDQKTGHAILDVLESIREKHGQTMLMVTHDPQIAARADRIVHLTDGRVLADDA